jgi:ribosomal protein S18 acetylase RimI-like enzyme
MEIKEQRGIIIQRARAKDLSEVYKLGCQTGELSFSPKGKFHDILELKEFVQKPKDNILLIATKNAQILGFLYAKIVSHSWCILDNLAVREDCRNHSIGKKLLQELYSILRERKISYVQVLEEFTNQKTREFWRKRGFKEKKLFVWADKTIK